MSADLLHRPVVMARCRGCAAGTQRRRSRPAEPALLEQLGVTEGIDQGHHLFVGGTHEPFGLLGRGRLMPTPELFVQLAVGPPVVWLRQERSRPSAPVVPHPGQQELMPFVQVRQDVPNVLVAPPMSLFPAGFAAEVERSSSFMLGHRIAQRAQFVELRRRELNQLIPGCWSGQGPHIPSEVLATPWDGDRSLRGSAPADQCPRRT